MSPKFETNELVWAKQRYSIPWPATVIDPPAGKNRKDSYYVFFFGTKNVGWVKKADVWPYTSFVAETKSVIKNNKYMEAVKKIAQIYHEEFQLNSPAFKRMKLAEQAENGEERVQPNGEELVPVPKADCDKDFMKPKKARRRGKKETTRQEKLQGYLKVRLFPKRGRKNKRKSINKDEKLVIQEAQDASSCITVNIEDYKKLVPNKLFVVLKRCDDGKPSLTSAGKEQSESEGPADQPPSFLPEVITID